MAETRNTFVKSKMNKDLDDRLLSKGEYRDAQNVQVSRSEGEDVGALENVLGNISVSNLPSTGNNLEVIGYLEDDTSNRAFFIVTNYSDTSTDMLSNVAPYDSLHYIIMRDLTNNTTSTLVTGRFLNFSKTHPVHGVDLVENLLFFSDNRNQPRKINIDKAIASGTYYTTEDQISVAKYYPYNAPLLWNEVTITGVSGSGPSYTTTDASNIANVKAGMNLKNTDIYVKSVNYSGTSPYTFTLTSTAGSITSMTFISTESKDVTSQYLKPSVFGRCNSPASTPSTNLPLKNVTSDPPNPGIVYNITSGGSSTIASYAAWTPGGSTGTLTLDTALPQVDNDIIEIAWPNPEYISSWPGDKEFLSDKFVRLAYRFRFDDNEYSVISPFTQPIFIPKQDGYILSEGIDGDNEFQTQEVSIANSTIISFFENKVNQALIRIEMPYVVNTMATNLKISELDIVYKESDGLAIRVLDTIPVTDTSITGNSTYYYDYTYQSRKPIRTLPEKETTRVFDKIPIRSLSQSVTGNRVVYGNFIDKHTSPNNLDYSIAINSKFKTQNGNLLVTGGYTSNCKMAYPLHTVKQNRNYQIGIVLADRYGRQSDVILSSIENFQQSQSGNIYNGSTLYNGYKESNFASQGWSGDSIKLLFQNAIPSTVSYADGYPGLYQAPTITGTVTSNTSGTEFVVQTISNYEIGDTIQIPDGGGGKNITSIIGVNTGTSTITVADEISPTATASYSVTIYKNENKLGWYSYKIVVKDQAEDYYNAFLGNISDIPNAASVRNAGSGSTSSFQGDFCTTLISDNVNKIPADLNQVGPEQTQFGTSDVQLNPRVGGDGIVSYPKQFYVGSKTAAISSYGKLTDIGLNDNAVGAAVTAKGMFQAGSNPPAAVFSIEEEVIGSPETSAMMFSVVEVKPRVSNLEIFWETSTSGLISELNDQIASGASSTPITPTDPPDPEE